MSINQINTTTSTQQTSQTTVMNKTDYSTYKQESSEIKDPNDLTYDEVTQLTREKIDETYKDAEKFRKQAHLLYRAANYSTDDTLNQSMFAQAKTLDTEEQKNSFTGMMFWTARMDKDSNFPIENLGFRLGADGMPIWDKNQNDDEFPRLNINFQSDDEVIDFIDMLIDHMEKNYDKGAESNNSHQKNFSSNNIDSL